MPSAIPADAAAALPPARMIDPRGHRFGASVSAILLVAATITQMPWLVALALLSIATSAAFGLKYSIYGTIWRRIVKVARLGPSEPEHEYPPRFAQVLGTAHAVVQVHRMGLRPRGRGLADAARGHGLLPGLPAVLPALVGAGSRHAHLDRWARPASPVRCGADPLQLVVPCRGGRRPAARLASPGRIRPWPD